MPSLAARQAAAALGLSLEHIPHAPPRTITLPPNLSPLPPLLLIRGPSGSGKSTILRAIVHHLRNQSPPPRLIRPDAIPLPSRRCIDLFRAPADIAMRALARAGLADHAPILRTPAALSEGQKARLQLALALHALDTEHTPDSPPQAARRTTHDVLLLDEFAASLDNDTAAAVAAMLRQRTRALPNLRSIVITHNDAAARALHPDATITLDTAHRATVTTRHAPAAITRPGSHLAHLRPEIATPADYRRLAHLHYRAAEPATIVRVLSIRRRSEPIAVLVISMPTLNATWRSLAWPDLDPRRTSPRKLAHRLNDPVRGVRCISRVIVDPRFRSLGLAAALVRHYLTKPLTARTEALAAMAHHSRFFTAAGMTAHHIPPAPRHARLLDLLHHARIEPHHLSTPSAAYRTALTRLGPALLYNELKHWATASRATSRHRLAPPETLFHLAAKHLASNPIAFTHEAIQPSSHQAIK